MKGAIAKCLGELVESRFGKEKWQQALEKAGIPRDKVFWPSEDIDDGKTMELIGAVCDVLDITTGEAADAFGEYWTNVYAPKSFSFFYKGVNSAREFLLKMDSVHVATTQQMKNTNPPRFGYEWEDERTLLMSYKSGRGLIDILVGLIKGVGKYYKENLMVTKMSPGLVRIVLPN